MPARKMEERFSPLFEQLTKDPKGLLSVDPLLVVEEVVSYLETLMLDRTLCQSLAKRSYFHPLGFHKIVIADGRDGGRVRIHTWPSEPEGLALGDIHNHFWDFSSLIVSGQFENEIFIEDPVQRNYQKYSLIPFGEGGYKLKECELTGLKSSAGQSFTPLDSYFLKANMIHRAISKSGGTTIVFNTHVKNENNLVFRPLQNQYATSRDDGHYFELDTYLAAVESTLIKLSDI